MNWNKNAKSEIVRQTMIASNELCHLSMGLGTGQMHTSNLFKASLCASLPWVTPKVYLMKGQTSKHLCFAFLFNERPVWFNWAFFHSSLQFNHLSEIYWEEQFYLSMKNQTACTFHSQIRSDLRKRKSQSNFTIDKKVKEIIIVFAYRLIIFIHSW